MRGTFGQTGGGTFGLSERAPKKEKSQNLLKNIHTFGRKNRIEAEENEKKRK